jgi:muramidase (phage lysozyme)
MPVPVRTLAAVTGLAATGAGGYYFANKTRQEASKAIVPVAATPETKQPYVPKYYDSRAFTLLTSSDIDARLRSGQLAIKTNTKNIKAIYTNQLPSNNPVEDNFSIDTFQNGLIAGVYDGNVF